MDWNHTRYLYANPPQLVRRERNTLCNSSGASAHWESPDFRPISLTNRVQLRYPRVVSSDSQFMPVNTRFARQRSPQTRHHSELAQRLWCVFLCAMAARRRVPQTPVKDPEALPAEVSTPSDPVQESGAAQPTTPRGTPVFAAGKPAQSDWITRLLVWKNKFPVGFAFVVIMSFFTRFWRVRAVL